jgi:hypothetical protein
VSRKAETFRKREGKESSLLQKVRKFLRPHKTTESQFDMRQNRHFHSKLANQKFGVYEKSKKLCRNKSYLTIKNVLLG